MERESDSLEQKLAKAISHKDLYKTALDRFCILFQRKMNELSLIKRIADSLNFISDLNKVCEDIVDCIIDETNAENCSLMLLDREKNKLSIICARGYQDFTEPGESHSKSEMPSAAKEFSLGEGIAGIVARTKKPILVKDALNDERFQKLEGGSKEIGSLISAPLVINDDVNLVQIIKQTVNECLLDTYETKTTKVLVATELDEGME